MDLRKRAELLSEVAQDTWARVLIRDSLDRNVTWANILETALKAGLDEDQIRIDFKVARPTWKRWLEGFASPSDKLRLDLGARLRQMVESKIAR